MNANIRVIPNMANAPSSIPIEKRTIVIIVEKMPNNIANIAIKLLTIAYLIKFIKRTFMYPMGFTLRVRANLL
jgi:hypothetical protein